MTTGRPDSVQQTSIVDRYGQVHCTELFDTYAHYSSDTPYPVAHFRQIHAIITPAIKPYELTPVANSPIFPTSTSRTGGWPWQQDAVVFPRDKGRFALTEGTESYPPAPTTTTTTQQPDL